MNNDITNAARALGKKGGKANTEAQNAARAENAKKGGRPSKRQIVCSVLGLIPKECSHGDSEYVSEFESRFGTLTRESFARHYDDADFTEWAIDRGY